jgi:leader peptidase (prepilin peptidase)/N-methyltransferase
VILAAWPVLAVTGALGAVLGSFLNVCIHRLPRGISVVRPPSACPACGERIRPYDNVPVLGWMWLGGRCRDCRSPISVRYPAVEALTAALFLLTALETGFTWSLLPALVFVSAMIVVTLVDYDARIVPDVITLPGIALGILFSFLTPLSVVNSLAGAALGFLLFLGIAWAYRRVTGVEGLGGGDIKLAAMLGAFLGVQGLFLTVFAASLMGTVVGVTMMLLGRGGRKTALPFGTFLAPAAVAAYFWAGDVIAWYVGLLVR